MKKIILAENCGLVYTGDDDCIPQFIGEKYQWDNFDKALEENNII